MSSSLMFVSFIVTSLLVSFLLICLFPFALVIVEYLYFYVIIVLFLHLIFWSIYVVHYFDLENYLNL